MPMYAYLLCVCICCSTISLNVTIGSNAIKPPFDWWDDEATKSLLIGFLSMVKHTHSIFPLISFLGNLLLYS